MNLLIYLYIKIFLIYYQRSIVQLSLVLIFNILISLFNLSQNKVDRPCVYFRLVDNFISKLQRIYEFERKLTELSSLYLYEIKTNNKLNVF